MRQLALVILTALVLTGCSGGSEDKEGGKKDGPTSSATPKPAGPTCADIWRAGKTLPDDYKSCVLDGTIAEQEVYECEDGTELVAFNDSMYAVTGKEIVEPQVQPFQDTEEYGKVYAECTGE